MKRKRVTATQFRNQPASVFEALDFGSEVVVTSRGTEIAKVRRLKSVEEAAGITAIPSSDYANGVGNYRNRDRLVLLRHNSPRYLVEGLEDV